MCLRCALQLAVRNKAENFIPASWALRISEKEKIFEKAIDTQKEIRDDDMATDENDQVENIQTCFTLFDKFIKEVVVRYLKKEFFNF